MFTLPGLGVETRLSVGSVSGLEVEARLPVGGVPGLGVETRLSVGGVPELEVDTKLPVVKEMLTVSSPADTVDKLPGVVVSSSVPSGVP